MCLSGKSDLLSPPVSQMAGFGSWPLALKRPKGKV